jgi:TolB-like protein
LKPNDERTENLNHTYYRDQINKVANAAKEIITALKKQNQNPGEVPKQEVEVIPLPQSNLKTKIITGSVIILVIIALGYFILPRIVKPSAVLEKSIAVLPFKNDSPDAENQYIIDGTMEAVLDNLCKIANLKVLSRTTVEQYRSTAKSVPEIAKELKVSYILEGSGQKYGDEIRLTVQLIDAVNDKHIWSSPYDRNIKDIFKIQSEIAQAIATEIKAIITSEEKELIEKIPTTSLTAYDYYLLGRSLWIQRSNEGILKAKSLFEKAIETDPEFALAYAVLAQLYCTLPFYNSWRPGDTYPHAMTLAIKALELDSTLSEAYSVIGAVKGGYYWDNQAAIKEFQHAIKLNPNQSTSYQWYSEELFYSGRFQEAVEIDELALKIDPLSPVINSIYALHLSYVNKKSKAVSHLNNMIDKYPGIGHFHWTLGIIFLMDKEYARAVEELQKAADLSGEPFYYLAQLGEAYNRAGKPYETQRLLDTINARTINEYTSYFPKAMLLAELGRNEEALYNLKRAYEERAEMMTSLKYIDTVSFSNLRSDPEFIRIMDMVWQVNNSGN